ncbi:MAG: InlB B-repeat-containing protein [Clostridiales bacterium]|nr:InlB B-repeat-containing protein [Clostridiales bacterium]
MKKGKLLLSALAAAVFATGAGALVACSDVELPQGGKQPEVITPPPVTGTGKVCTVTFDANGGTLVGSSTLKTDTNGIVQGTVPTATKADNTFKGWTLTQGSTTVINFTTQKFTSDKPVYAVYAPNQNPGPTVENEYTITFLDGEHGTVSGQNEIKTTNKKISTFPAIIEENGWKFDYWALTNDETTHVDTDYTFTGTTTVTAHYKEDENYDPDVDDDTYYLIGSITEWGVNATETYTFAKTEDSGDGKDQYLLTVELQTNDVIKIVKGNKAQYISSWEGGWDFADIDTSDSEDNGNLTITQDGTYDIYRKVNK